VPSTNSSSPRIIGTGRFTAKARFTSVSPNVVNGPPSPDVVELVHYTMYRPPAALSSDPKNQIRHPAGLAIDVGAFRKRDGRWLSVGPHWPSAIGDKTCGTGAREHWAREARELVSIVCEAMDQRIFHFMLTPDFDAAHADHVHLEIKPGARWFIVN
jgi:hypothetical protein